MSDESNDSAIKLAIQRAMDLDEPDKLIDDKIKNLNKTKLLPLELKEEEPGDTQNDSENQENNRDSTSEFISTPMKALRLDDDESDDLDNNSSASSRPPPEPFAIEEYSEDDDRYEDIDIRSIPGFEDFIKARSGMYPDAKFMLQYIDPTFLKYGSLYAETNKWNTNAYDYYGFDDPDPSYAP